MNNERVTLFDLLEWLERLMHRLGERWTDEDDEYLQQVIDTVYGGPEGTEDNDKEGM